MLREKSCPLNLSVRFVVIQVGLHGKRNRENQIEGVHVDASQRAYKKRKKKSGKWGRHRGDRTAQTRSYRAKYPERVRANQILRDAVAAGVIKKPKWCQRCKHRPVHGGHHEDYDKPLDVDWLCWRCHNKLKKKAA